MTLFLEERFSSHLKTSGKSWKKRAPLIRPKRKKVRVLRPRLGLIRPVQNSWAHLCESHTTFKWVRGGFIHLAQPQRRLAVKRGRGRRQPRRWVDSMQGRGWKGAPPPGLPGGGEFECNQLRLFRRTCPCGSVRAIWRVEVRTAISNAALGHINTSSHFVFRAIIRSEARVARTVYPDSLRVAQ